MDGTTSPTTAIDIRKKLGHPVIDGDGHVLEPNQIILEYVKKLAGAELAMRFEKREMPFAHSNMKSIYWWQPSGKWSLDRATAILPKLYAKRLDEAGIDFGMCYSTAILPLMHERNDEFRQVGHRALNMYLADVYADVKDRLMPSAGIPMYNPEEAIAEIEFVVNDLNMKAITVGTEVHRTPNAIIEKAPELKDHFLAVHSVAMDALHDYDPVWRKCRELGLAVASHTSARGRVGSRRVSPSSYVFNHLGDFAEGGEFFCRSLFLGGVTRRFPGLNFAFLEGGVSFAGQLYNDLYEHWEKRNIEALFENLNPADMDYDLLGKMAEKYGGKILTPEIVKSQPRRQADQQVDELDEFKALEITSGNDIAKLFTEPFYFGCEADDRMNAIAFNRRLHHKGVQLKAMFGSDIGHWDVMDMRSCVPEAYQLVEDGIMNEDDFRKFMFSNPMEFFTTANPEFFNGTVVEDAVKKELADR